MGFHFLLLHPHYEIPSYTLQILGTQRTSCTDWLGLNMVCVCHLCISIKYAPTPTATERRIFSWLTRSRARSAEHSTVFHTIPAAFANLSDQQGSWWTNHPESNFQGFWIHINSAKQLQVHLYIGCRRKVLLGPQCTKALDRKDPNFRYCQLSCRHLARLWFNLTTFTAQNIPTKRSSLLPCKCVHFSSFQQVSNPIDTPFPGFFFAKCPVPGFRASKMNHRSIGRAQTIEQRALAIAHLGFFLGSLFYRL